jgi:hypothetical protein
VFEQFWSLALRLNIEHPNYLKDIHSDNETEFMNASFDHFSMNMVLTNSFLSNLFLNRLESWNE